MSSLAHHLQIGPDEVSGNDGRGRVFLLPGSPGRAAKIATHFSDVRVCENPRRMDVHLGTLELDGVKIDIASAPTGMGCPSLGIVVTELIRLGARRLLRVGTAGILQPELLCGHLVIATGAVRDEASSDAFAPRDVPALAHLDWIAALTNAARKTGHGERTFAGVVHSKDSLYGREFPLGPRAKDNEHYMEILRKLGVLATEMESSHLFMLAAVQGLEVSPITGSSPSRLGVKAGTILAMIGDDEHGFAPEELARTAEERAIEVALQASVELIAAEDS